METIISLFVIILILVTTGLALRGRYIKKQEADLQKRRQQSYEWFNKEVLPKIQKQVLFEIDHYAQIFKIRAPMIQQLPINKWVNQFILLSKKYHASTVDLIDISLINSFKNENFSEIENKLRNRLVSIYNTQFIETNPKPKVLNPISKPKDLVSPINDDLILKIKEQAADDKQLRDFSDSLEDQNAKLKSAYQKSEEYYKSLLQKYNEAIEKINIQWNQERDNWEQQKAHEINSIEKFIETLEEDNIEEICQIILNSPTYPSWIPKNFELNFDLDSRILIIEQEFPNVESIEFTKAVTLRTSVSTKKLNQKEKRETIENFYPLIILRIMIDVAKALQNKNVELLVLNGWVNFRNRSTGKFSRAYVASLAATIDKLLGIDLNFADPLAALLSLKGNVSRTSEITPIAPISRINSNDPRFIDDREILQKMDADENLASMPWEDFEHLCRELFERIFAKNGATVKVTQASRDQGVDAVIIDPRPIHGGKTVIQAKRYVNTVDVSAVRDLYGTVNHEGANKGILVTTSQFGPDAYSFIQGKNLELVNGSELLFLLSEHGYNFRIDLEEARRIQRESGELPFKRRNFDN